MLCQDFCIMVDGHDKYSRKNPLGGIDGMRALINSLENCTERINSIMFIWELWRIMMFKYKITEKIILLLSTAWNCYIWIIQLYKRNMWCPPQLARIPCFGQPVWSTETKVCTQEETVYRYEAWRDSLVMFQKVTNNMCSSSFCSGPWRIWYSSKLFACEILGKC